MSISLKFCNTTDRHPHRALVTAVMESGVATTTDTETTSNSDGGESLDGKMWRVVRAWVDMNTAASGFDIGVWDSVIQNPSAQPSATNGDILNGAGVNITADKVIERSTLDLPGITGFGEATVYAMDMGNSKTCTLYLYLELM